MTISRPSVKTVLKVAAGIFFLAWVSFLTLTIRHTAIIVARTCSINRDIAFGEPQHGAFEFGVCPRGFSFHSEPLVWPRPAGTTLTDDEANAVYHGGPYAITKPVLGNR